MRTVLVIEDQFLESFELECLLKERGYEVQHAATHASAIAAFQNLTAQNDLAAIICDNLLIGNQPAAMSLYRKVRSVDPQTPFVVYSGYPPQDLPRNDPQLTVVRKPFRDEVLSFVGNFAPPRGRKGHVIRPALRTREAA